MSKDSVKWDIVEKGVERAQGRMVWKPYGAPEIIDPEHTIFHDNPIQPPWEVSDKIVVQSAITGAFFSRRANPNQPISVEEILASARECAANGASAIHLHMRDDKGYNVLDPDKFRAVIEPLRAEFPGISVDGCYVTALQGEWDAMKLALKEKLLDAVPVNTTAVFQGDALFAKPIPLMLEKTRLILESGAKPVVAVYADADVSNAQRYLFRSGLLESGQIWCVLPALPGCSPMDNPEQMFNGLLRFSSLIRDVDPDARILVCAAGRASSYLATVAAALGLHIRMGMEDTVWRWPHRNEKLESNLQALENGKQIADALGRNVATFQEYREIVGLPAKHDS
jgi:3-keto-5-aminohexanoate cleavage enzyme